MGNRKLYGLNDTVLRRGSFYQDDSSPTHFTFPLPRGANEEFFAHCFCSCSWLILFIWPISSTRLSNHTLGTTRVNLLNNIELLFAGETFLQNALMGAKFADSAGSSLALLRSGKYTAHRLSRWQKGKEVPQESHSSFQNLLCQEQSGSLRQLDRVRLRVLGAREAICWRLDFSTSHSFFGKLVKNWIGLCKLKDVTFFQFYKRKTGRRLVKRRSDAGGQDLKHAWFKACHDDNRSPGHSYGAWLQFFPDIILDRFRGAQFPIRKWRQGTRLCQEKQPLWRRMDCEAYIVVPGAPSVTLRWSCHWYWQHVPARCHHWWSYKCCLGGTSFVIASIRELFNCSFTGQFNKAKRDTKNTCLALLPDPWK